MSIKSYNWKWEKCLLYELVGYPLFRACLSNAFCYTFHQKVFLYAQLQPHLSFSPMNVCLVVGANSNEGRVEVCVNGINVGDCDQQWMGLKRDNSGVQTTWISEPR